MSRRVELSLVIPLFNERENVAALHEEAVAVLQGLGVSWEAIYVDDGSTDGTHELLLASRALHPANVCVIRFRRNFGQTAAIAAGFNRARGEVIVTMDGDLQNDPSEIPRLLAKLAEGYDLVSGWRHRRRDPLLTRRIPSVLANGLIGLLTGVPLHDHGCTLKAYRREIVEQLTLYGEMHRFLAAQAHWVGARIAEIPVNHRRRRQGTSKYGILRTYRVLLDLLTVRFLGVHGTHPLHAFGALGFVLVGLGVLTLGTLTYLKLTTGVSFIQSPLLLLAALFAILGGQSFLLGLLAEISVRTYYESQRKPIYVVRDVQAPEELSAAPAAGSGAPGRVGTRDGSAGTR